MPGVREPPDIVIKQTPLPTSNTETMAAMILSVSSEPLSSG